MAKFNYRKSQKTATKLIENFGQELVITHTEEGAFDPSTGLIPSVTTTQNGLGVLLDHGNREIDGTIITIYDKKLLLSAKTTADGQLEKPHINDTVYVDGVNYMVKDPLKEIKPNGTVAVMYILNLRG